MVSFKAGKVFRYTQHHLERVAHASHYGLDILHVYEYEEELCLLITIRAMDASILSVHWHENSEPVYSVHYQPNRDGNPSERLVTGGGDNNVRVSVLCIEYTGFEY